MPPKQTLAKTKVTKTYINNNNIKDLVYDYIYFRHRLPDDLKDIKIGNWDVSRVTNMSQLFAAKETFNEPLNDWNVSKVNDMEYMFLNASQFDQPLDKWNVSKVKNMENMFQGSSLSHNPNWKLDRKVLTKDMFRDTPLERQMALRAKQIQITNNNIHKLVDMYIHDRHKLPGNLKYLRIGDWDVSRVTNMSYLFAGEDNFNEPIDDWNVSNVKNMESMFLQASRFNKNLSKWNVSSVDNMQDMFRDAYYFDNKPTWNIGPKVNTTNMFKNTLMERHAAAMERRAAENKQSHDSNSSSSSSSWGIWSSNSAGGKYTKRSKHGANKTLKKVSQ